jgi:signal transduction histidine kinase
VSLGNKLILFLTLPLILIMVLFGALSQMRSRDLIHRELLREGRAVVRVAQEAMEDYLRDHQLEDLRDLGNQLTGFERIVGVELFDRDGQVVYTSATLTPEDAPSPPDLEAALRRSKGAETQRRRAGTPVISFVRPLVDSSGAIIGAIHVLHAESFIDEAMRESRDWDITLTIIMIAATAIVVIVVARAGIDRPVADLVNRFRAVGSGDLSSRVPLRRGDEFGELGREFEGMVAQLEDARRSLLAEQEERRRVEEHLRRSERLASVGRLAAGLAHEIGTPLNVIGGRAEALQRRLAGNEATGRSLAIITSQIERISRIVRSLLDFARGSTPRLAPTSVVDVVRGVLDLMEHRIDHGGVHLALEVEPDLPRVRADADQLQQVFLNLASNALDAMPDGGSLTIRAARAQVPTTLAEAQEGAGTPGSSPPAGFVSISIADTGTGIRAEHQGRVFDPFFTTKDVGQGTGLGLSVSYGIVRDHGGALELDSLPGAGSRFTVYLPVDGPRPSVVPAPERRSLEMA